LDSLRFFAVFLVIFHHFLPEFNLGHFSFGESGVQIFFVISGFLISNILMSKKQLITNSIADVKKTLINFYARRMLRLFPAYYLLLVILISISLIFGLWIVNQKWMFFSYFFYLQNFLFFFKGLQSSLLNHTWSLAVEEQFYLFLPLIILLFRKGTYLLFIGLFLFIGMFSKFYFAERLSPENPKFFLLSNLDTLGAGAMLSYLYIHFNSFLFSRWSLISALLILFFTLFFIANSSYIINQVSLLLFSASVLIVFIHPIWIFKSSIFDNQIFRYLGKISYGL
ncbi:MAG: acyltransferase family protein, partial [Bacteroidota bacterium]